MCEKELKNRRTTRLQGNTYNGDASYFITICTRNKQCTLSRILVGTGVLDGPRGKGESSVALLPRGEIADRYIRQMNAFYEDVSVDAYVIMPNHIHLLMSVKNTADSKNGPSGTPVPTIQNSVVSKFVSTFKRFCNKECGENIWQYRSNDHVIRNRKDYEEHVRYIGENPARWHVDELYAMDET